MKKIIFPLVLTLCILCTGMALSEAVSYWGIWDVTEVRIGESSFSADEVGLEISMMLDEDGTYMLESNTGDPESGYWSVSRNGIRLGTMALTLQTDGTLITDTDSTHMVFTHVVSDIPESASTQVSTASEADNPYPGTWTVESVRINGTTYHAEDVGLVMSLTLYEDGTCVSTDSDGLENRATWYRTNEGAWVDGTLCILQKDGSLQIDQDGVSMILVHVENNESAAVISPAPSPFHFDGTWTVSELQIGAGTYAASDFGLDTTLILNADGSYTLSAAGDKPVSGRWSSTSDGVTAGRFQLTCQDDGTLATDFAGIRLIFHLKTEVPPTLAPTAESAQTADYSGTWKASAIRIGDTLYSAEDLGYVCTLTLESSGTYTMMLPDSSPDTGTWKVTSGGIRVGGILLTPQSDGTLLAAQDSTQIYFSRDDSSPVSASSSAATDGLLFGTRYLASTVEVGGYSLDASALGGEYSVTFYADGTAVFVTAGEKAGDLKWTRDGTDYVIDYYGSDLRFQMIPEGLKLNFLNSMVLTLLPG